MIETTEFGGATGDVPAMPGMPMLDGVLQYAKLGVHLFPCWWIVKDIKNPRCACGNAVCKSPGKHPIHTLVPRGHLDASPDPEVWEAWWAAFPLANPAMSLEPSGLVVIDIDPRNGGDATFDLLEAKHGRIMAEAEQLSGGGGRHLFFVADQNARYPGKLGAGVDVKHKGYVMTWPAWHISLRQYEMEASGDILDGAIPGPAPRWLALPPQAEYDVNLKPAAPGLGLDALSEREIEEIKSALDYIPNGERETWREVGMAIHSMDSGRPGFELWVEWSATHAKFDPQDQARVWHSFHGKARQLNRESIYFWAAQHGWDNPLKRKIEISPQVADAAKKIADAVLPTVDPPTISASTPDANQASGGHSRFPPGLEEVATLLAHGTSIHQTDAAIAAALSLASFAASRRYVGPNGEPCHLHIGAVGRSVGPLRRLHNNMSTVLMESGLRRMLRTQRMGAPSHVYRTLVKSAATLYLTDEWGHLLEFAKRQPSGVLSQTLGLIASFYDRREALIDSAEEAGFKNRGDDQPVIYRPALSMFALLSHDQLSALARPGEIGRGALETLLLTVTDDDGADDDGGEGADDAWMREFGRKEFATPDWLKDHLLALRGLSRPDGGGRLDFSLDDLADNMGDLPGPDPIRVAMPDDVARSVMARERRIMSLPAHKSRRPLLRGACVSARRLDIALAAWLDPAEPVATHEVVEWVGRYVEERISALLDRYDLISSDDGKPSVYQKVLEHIADAGKTGLSIRQLRDLCWNFRCMNSEKRRELLEQLIDDLEVVDSVIFGKKVLVATKFAATSDAPYKGDSVATAKAGVLPFSGKRSGGERGRK